MEIVELPDLIGAEKIGKLKGKLLLIFSAVGGIIYLFGFVFYKIYRCE